MYAREYCTCNRTVRTDDSDGSSPTIYSSLITFIETHSYCHCILHEQPDHLLPYHQHLVDQPAKLPGQDNMITVVPRLPCQSSSTPVAPRTCTKQPGIDMLDVWLQSRLVRGRRDRSTLDLEINLFSSLTILWGSLTWAAFTEDLLMCPYTRYVCKLIQLFHYMRLDI